MDERGGILTRVRRGVMLGFAVMLGLLTLATGAAAADAPLLRKGVSLGNWLQLDGRQRFTAQDMTTIRNLGFDHVRIAVDPKFLGWTFGADGHLPGLARLDSAISLATQAGLTAILDMHLMTSDQMAIERDPELEDDVVALWRMLSRHYADIPNDLLVFELYNEPQYYNQQVKWESFLRRMVAAVRRNAPQRTLIVSGAMGASITGLGKMVAPVEDPNLVWAFHFYEPYIVTHQGAGWMADKKTAIPHLRQVPYPPSPSVEALVKIDGAVDEDAARKELRHYLTSDWSGAKIGARIGEAAVWAARNRSARGPAKVLCTEFGVFRKFSSDGDRLRWLADTRRAIEQNGFGWTVWDYSDGFGITRKFGADPVKIVPAETAAALGLAQP